MPPLPAPMVNRSKSYCSPAPLPAPLPLLAARTCSRCKAEVLIWCPNRMCACKQAPSQAAAQDTGDGGTSPGSRGGPGCRAWRPLQAGCCPGAVTCLLRACTAGASACTACMRQHDRVCIHVRLMRRQAPCMRSEVSMHVSTHGVHTLRQARECAEPARQAPACACNNHVLCTTDWLTYDSSVACIHQISSWLKCGG